MLLLAGLLIALFSFSRVRYAFLAAGLPATIVLCLMFFPPVLYALIVVGLALEFTKKRP